MAFDILKVWNALKSSEENVEGTKNALSQVSLTHRMIHDGRAFTHSQKHANIAAGATHVHYLEVGSSDLHVDYFQVIADAAPIDIEYFEGTAVSSVGAPLAFGNNNRSSIRTPLTSIYSQPVITTTGSALGVSFIPNASAAVGASIGGDAILGGGEWILKAGTNYSFVVTNGAGSAVDITVTLFGYEPDNP